MAALRRLVPVITRAEYESYRSTHGGSHDILKTNSLKNAFAFPSVSEVERAVEPEILHRAVELRKLVDSSFNGMDKVDYLEVTNGQYRMLATWHTHIFFADSAHDLALKRLMRDHVHYRSEIYKFAAAGVDQLGGLGTYTSLHIRRGDFQYRETRITADVIFQNVLPLLKRSGKKRLYISTDEQDAAFFMPFRRAGYEVLLWRDLSISAAGTVPYPWIGLVEQLVAAHSNLFIGTRLSTFSSYIMRVHNYNEYLPNKELFYCDRSYTGDPVADGNEKLIDLTNSRLGGGELFYFREPRMVWALDKNISQSTSGTESP